MEIRIRSHGFNNRDVSHCDRKASEHELREGATRLITSFVNADKAVLADLLQQPFEI